jgi:L-amino acid N-acyltransferase YncA
VSLTIRPYQSADAAELAELLNAVIARGGTTALEDAFSPEQLAETYLDGPNVLACFVAVDSATGRIEGFQTLGRYPNLPDDVGDIGTFARVDGSKRGVGSALFAAMVECAHQLRLSAINATIRGDNEGGLVFYGKQGFEDHAITAAVPLKDGTPVDRVHKRFTLAMSERLLAQEGAVSG